MKQAPCCCEISWNSWKRMLFLHVAFIFFMFMVYMLLSYVYLVIFGNFAFWVPNTADCWTGKRSKHFRKKWRNLETMYTKVNRRELDRHLDILYKLYFQYSSITALFYEHIWCFLIKFALIYCFCTWGVSGNRTHHNIMLLSIQPMHHSSLFITLELKECVLLGYSDEEQLTPSTIPAIARMQRMHGPN